MSRINNWNSVIDVVKARLASWKAKTLSIGGRLILIKAVLENLPIYYFSLYRDPMAVINVIEAIMRRFLWAGSSEEKKIPWVAWETITKSKKEGGLGLNRLQDTNEALLLKWTWRFKKKGNSLWKRVVVGCYGSIRTWTMLPCSTSASSCWKRIVKVGEKKLFNGRDLNSYFVGVVGNGSIINFWMDNWLGNGALRIRFPHLFPLEKSKWVTIDSRMRMSNGVKVLSWDWRRNPATVEEVQELFTLLSELHGVKNKPSRRLLEMGRR